MGTSLDESARLAGGHQWTESRLFEVLGGWVADTPEPELRLLLDRHSHHCAWRAAQWWDRLPVLADVPRESLCAAPGPEVERALQKLAALEGTPARLAGAYRVALPRLWTSYRRHEEQAGPVADGSTLRTLGIVAADLAADWHEGEAALQETLTQPSNIREAAAASAALEELLVAGG